MTAHSSPDELAVRTADELAVAVSARMYGNDRASQALGMTLIDTAEGRAKMSMRIRADMLNGHGMCHGGYIFMLADSTFAFACNSRNQVTVAASCNIDFLRPAYENDVLTASAKETALVGRTGIYDIVVENQKGELVATFRGKSARISGQVLDDENRTT